MMNDNDLDQAFDQLQQQSTKAPPYLAQRVLANLPEREPLDRLWQWFSVSLWRVAAGTALPLLLGVAVGMSSAGQTEDSWAEAEALVFADALAEYEYDEI